MKKFPKNLSHVQIIALGFLIIILLGAALLSLPAASADGNPPSFLTSLFTATSATCVTGLVVADTAAQWSVFGRTVIIVLIQLGGLGFMTVATFFFTAFSKRVGLREREVMVESINASKIGGITKLTKKILIFTGIFELSGAVILSVRFIAEYGFSVPKGIYFGFFHSISAFCNAGFDLNGNYTSFTSYAEDPVVSGVLMLLIIFGGLGFFVWDDLVKKRFRFKRLELHSKIVITVSAVLIVSGSVLFFITEYSYSASGLSTGGKILTSLFSSVTPRTAGFNSVDTALLSPAGKFITVILMFIGGSPSSTAGGIKTTTFAVLLMYCISEIRHTRFAGAFGRRIPHAAFSKAATVFFINLSAAIAGTVIISVLQPGFDISDVIFETFSAIGTVGMTTGITRDLGTVSRIVIIVMMFMGRIGSVSFGAALMKKKAVPQVVDPHEDITVG